MGNYAAGFAFALEDYDKGFFIAYQGVTQDFGVCIYKTDVNGNILWERKISQNKAITFAGAVITPDNGLVIEGAMEKTDSTEDNYLMKINACGQVEWCKVYDLNQYSIGGRVAVLNNGDLVVAAYVDIYNNYYQGWTFLTDSQGNIKWQVFDNLNIVNLNVEKNQEILRTGSCYLPYSGNPNVVVIECALINLNSSGKGYGILNMM